MSNKSNPDFQWTKKITQRFIELLRTHPCLWQTKNRHYKSKDVRHASVKFLVKEMSESMKCKVTHDDVMKKLHTLRGQFRKEVKAAAAAAAAAIAAAAAGNGTACELYVPKLWCFDSLTFLLDGELLPPIGRSITPLDVYDSQETSPHQAEDDVCQAQGVDGVVDEVTAMTTPSGILPLQMTDFPDPSSDPLSLSDSPTPLSNPTSPHTHRTSFVPSPTSLDCVYVSPSLSPAIVSTSSAIPASVVVTQSRPSTTLANSTPASSRPAKKRKQSEAVEEAMKRDEQGPSPSLPSLSENDPCLDYGKVVGNELKGMKEMQRNLVKKLINDAMHLGNMELLSVDHQVVRMSGSFGMYLNMGANI